jgi:trans-2,3-dihydro-3-hydroxyanthranilate isomerase
MARSYPFVWVDVFAKTALEGNQLAVFPDARGLRDEEMQSIARETHLSETTFVFPRDEPVERAEGIRTRIFAVSGEMPFAGHPTLGTASVLRQRKRGDEIALALPVGRIPVSFSVVDGLPFGEMTQKEPEIGATHDRRRVAKALRAPIESLEPDRPIQTVSTGVPFAIVPFRSREALARLRPDASTMDEYLSGTDAKYFYLIAKGAETPGASVHARMIFAGGEDPATGAAAGPAIAWMVLHGWARSGEPMVLEQGLEVHRPSSLHLRAELAEGRPTRVRVGGHCVPVIRGELTL